MRLIRFIKIFLISLYVVFLGFVLFFNTSSVYGADVGVQTSVFQVSEGFDNYFQNIQDSFDYNLINNKSIAGFNSFYNYFYGGGRSRDWNYFVLQAQRVPGHENDTIAYARGYVIYEYAVGNNATNLQTTGNFSYADFENFGYLSDQERSMIFQAYNIQTWRTHVIFNRGANYELYQDQTNLVVGVPCSLVQYSHPIVQNYIMESNTSGSLPIVNAIHQQSNVIANETRKQTNAITTATKEQTNALLDTNDTGNETMSVNDTTTDTSADLGGLFNQISGAFTDTSQETQKRF